MAADNERQPLLVCGKVLMPSSQRRLACAAILVAELFERVACYSFSGALVYYLTTSPFCWTNAASTLSELLFTAVMYATGLFGGWIADSYLGRYKAVILGYVIYIVGYVYLPLLSWFVAQYRSTSDDNGTCMPWEEDQSPFFCHIRYDGRLTCGVTMYLSIIFIAIGAGVVRTNLIPFGGDQARGGGPECTQQFFTAYYWCINIGAIIAFVGIAFLREVNSFFACIVASGALVLSLIVFLVGTKVYIGRSAGSINIFKLIRNACKVKRSNVRLRNTAHSFLDYANMENEGGKFNVNHINDVKQLGRICKVFLLMIPYWICYSQMTLTTFVLQGMYMRLDFHHDHNLCPNPRLPPSTFNFTSRLSDCGDGNATHNIDDHSNNLTIPSSSLTLFNSAFIILLLPFTQLIYRALTRCNVKVMVWKRLYVGMFLAMLALVAGGTLEFLRLTDIYHCGFHYQMMDNKVYAVAPHISRFWQIPQYCLLGASEVFFVVTGIEYAYMESPQNMQGIVMGLFWFSEGIGYFVGAAVSYLIWDTDAQNINCNRVNLFLFALGLFLLIGSFCFIIVAIFADLDLKKIIDPQRPFRLTELSESFPSTPQPTRRNRLEDGTQPLLDDDAMED